MGNEYDMLKLDNQICFPLYVASKEIIRKYKPFLDEINLTYTQYIAMMAMWEHKELSVKELGELLYLDSGTLTPLLKTLEKKGYIDRKRSTQDERIMQVSLTDEGEKLKKKALSVPTKVAECVPLSNEDAAELYRLLHLIM
ncbi:MAG: MarR family transcriptional regulator [Lachnospiraceae bacterium]|nr:MarR family transcriptional regulator [Candidatus Colinaster scatohippi]